ncbi:MAG: hypothetical protein ACR2H2_02825, partial [Solirubrobacteraceae bacterium]
REGEPVAATAAPARPAPRDANLRSRARAIIGRELRSGALRHALGSAATAVRIVQIGELRTAGTTIGATALLALPSPLRGVDATVPGYVAAPGGYRSQPVRFTATRLSDLLVDATAHLDRADGCSTPPTVFGFSEEAERRVAEVVARRLRWRVQRNVVDLGNAEPYRRDTTDSAHVWCSDGRATLISVP